MVLALDELEAGWPGSDHGSTSPETQPLWLGRLASIGFGPGQKIPSRGEWPPTPVTA